MNRILILCLAITPAPALWGADEAEQTPSPGHSLHGEVFNEGPRQAAVLIPGTTNCHLEVTTKAPEAQKFFDQGIGQLHGFWDFEAERSFRQAAALDPDCAMAYWGMAMANLGNKTRSKGFIEEAIKRKGGVSEREQKWIDALAKFYENEKTDEKTRRLNLVRAHEDIVVAYPDDVEAKAFLMKQIYANKSQHPFPSHLTIDLLITEILKQNPMHPAQHYRIHLWDSEKPERALAASAQCGPSGPGIAHLWHMPGHIYSKLHRYEDAVWQQEASARVDHAHMTRFQLIPDQIHNYAHNNEWMTRNLNNTGEVERAIDQSCNMIELPRLPKLDGDGKYNGGGSWDYGRQRLRDTLMRYELWERLLSYGESEYLKAGSGKIDETEWRRFMGVAAFESGARCRGQQLLADLKADLAKVNCEQGKAVKDAEEKNKDKKDDEKKKAVEGAKKNFKTKIEAREKALKELAAYDLVFADEPKVEEAGKALDEAGTMGKSRKAMLFLKLGDSEKAIKLATEDVSASKNQVQPLATKAHILWEAGKKDEAKTEFEVLRKMANVADRNLPVFQRLAPIAKELGIEGDWRLPREPSKDLGERPDLASLGPFRWQPPKAAAFTLNDAENKPVSLADYAGKPVLVVFFLGRGCVHCMEQLTAFAPVQKDFAEAGIEVLAVSTDSPEGLRLTYWLNSDDEQSPNPFPFPLLSDEKLDAFHAYHAYDDFEKMPLHGTFLIDEVGRIRWQNISHEPFMKPEFVLEESKRLLSYEDS